ncbi:MAG: DMT family transporter [Nitrospinaceae bacterium]|mgnify:CR=1 FL=1|nr:DMT family transporter [Nitrospinaceae bacterium]MBT3434333.1 DMT family transporter [Nitrospinaceae bacterium]MBT3820079.1 DMT family transporter [Nitrospinaceae bacterium]MBT4094970.1 DMT family transporter [Nitrospinaceae bacterium]MBT4432241.1 DMT family transporter [Nitrospinaceae bacterium]
MLESIDPNLLAFLGAIIIAVARTLYRGALSRLGPGVVALFSSAITLVISWLYFWAVGDVDVWHPQGLFWFALIGFMGGLGNRYLSFFSMSKVGLARTSILMQTSLLWSSLLAIAFLGERPTHWVILGSITIMLGSILLVYRRENEKLNIRFVYYLIPLAIALIQGFSQLFRKYGYYWLPSASLGMSVANSMAMICLLVVVPFAEDVSLKRWEQRPAYLVILGALFNAFAMILFWTAVKMGNIVEVIPINRLSVLLIILFSWLFFRKQEAITAQVVLGGFLSVAGAWAIVLGK